ncbi:MAG: UMP kinase [Candidatus Lokiarchaeota archaeon]|nr:UMP kinase [Candidatus Lokiarchaeota archaeon]
MKNIVIKIGGSILFSEDLKINIQQIIKFCNIIKANQHYDKVIIVCGGGIIARNYISAIRYVHSNEASNDIMGIKISQINARLLMEVFGEKAFPEIPKRFDELAQALLFNKIIIMGGLQPGQSTTSVALEVAEFIEADQVVILTNVTGIYDKDPNRFDDARLIKNLTLDKLQNLIIKDSNEKQAAAGEYRIFDAVSLQIMKRSKIKVYVVSGTNLDEFKKIWVGESDFNGTVILN